MKAMTDAEVITAIEKCHLKANISWPTIHRRYWEEATIDPGGSVFGPGPYLKLPVSDRDGERCVIRVYPPERLRRRLAKAIAARTEAA